jgi:CO/xanthine dehydrogenase FAD-binding subunit
VTIARPRTLEEALRALGQFDATIVAGGTDVMVEVNRGHRVLSDVVAVRRIAELRRLRIDSREVRVGAAIPYAELIGPGGMSSAAAPVLYEAAKSMGSTQIRAMGTIGGNIGTGSSVGDALCALLALDARATVAGVGLIRDASVAGIMREGLAAGELIVDVYWPLARGPQRFLKVCRRAAVSRSVVSASVVVDPDRSVRIVLGGCAREPIRAEGAEILAYELMTGWHFPPDAVAAIADAVRNEIDPPTDVAASSDYRRHAAGVLVARALSAPESHRAAA